jgi:purine-nucleoside phosphorylase
MSDDTFRLTALDVRRYDFGTAFRGYEKARVEQFREQVAAELERLVRAGTELEQKARNFHEQLRVFRERDRALNDALVAAQQMGTATKEAAEREADLIRREARAVADRILEEARREASVLVSEARREASRQSEQLRGEQRRLEEETASLDRVHRTYLAQLRLMAERPARRAERRRGAHASSAAPPGRARVGRLARAAGRARVTAVTAHVPAATGAARPASPDRVAAAADAVRARHAARPLAAIVLGTGLGGLAERMDVAARVPYARLPGMPRATVESHAGRLLCGTLAGVPVIAMQGRLHRYEGHAMADVGFPVRVLRALGAEVLVVSNACGGMHPLWAPGDVMLMADHLNVLGDSPLVGPHDAADGPRFPDLTAAYDVELRAVARRVAAARGLVLREGVYAAVLGPNLETRAEYRMLRLMGPTSWGCPPCLR